MHNDLIKLKSFCPLIVKNGTVYSERQLKCNIALQNLDEGSQAYLVVVGRWVVVVERHVDNLVAIHSVCPLFLVV